jgi:S1-C subfamily serine protease
MPVDRKKHEQREVVVAAVGGLLWAVSSLVLSSMLSASALATPCRVHNYLSDGSANVGSGTLIDVTTTGERGLVLSCAHLFTEGTGRLVVEFAGGRTHGALLVDIDHNADLVALEIAKPLVPPTPVNQQLESSSPLRACGFGPSGQFRCAEGSVLGFSERPGQQSLRMSGAVRSGDSGGASSINRADCARSCGAKVAASPMQALGGRWLTF